MPRKKKTGRKKTIVKKEVIPEISDKENTPLPFEDKLPKKSFWSKKTILLILIMVIIIFFWKFKNLFIVAFVDGQPITRWQLTNQLVNKFGDQMLDNIISERILEAEIRKKGIFITPDEITSRVKEVEKRLDGKMALNDALKAQGMTMEEFKKQIEIQLAIDKLFDKEATVSTQEIEDYIAKNSTAYKNATDPALLREEVKSILHQQKISDLFDTWYSEIRNKAKVIKYL